MGSAQQPNRESAESPPIRTLEVLLSLLSNEETAPTDLVACEFSGAMRSALEREGRRAISADWRECDIGGLHFCGDIRVILAAKQWERAYIFPLRLWWVTSRELSSGLFLNSRVQPWSCI
jgi:hypothetical protein